MKHSPGPFTKGSLRSCEREILGHFGCTIAMVPVPIGVPRDVDPCDVQDANVALFVAAPDLLACAEAAATTIGLTLDHAAAPKLGLSVLKSLGLAEELLRNAIAKARGGSR